jgi:hypothetical protein
MYTPWSTHPHSYFLLRMVGWESLLGTQSTAGPIVPTPDDSWVWSNRWNENWQGKPKSLENARASATSSTTNPTWPELGLNPDRRDGKPATNRLSYSPTPTPALRHSCMCLISGTQYFVQTSFVRHIAILKFAQTQLQYSYLCTVANSIVSCESNMHDRL